jgi:hypothetical protein
MWGPRIFVSFPGSREFALALPLVISFLSLRFGALPERAAASANYFNLRKGAFAGQIFSRQVVERKGKLVFGIL